MFSSTSSPLDFTGSAEIVPFHARRSPAAVTASKR